MYTSVYEPSHTTLLAVPMGKLTDSEWQTLYEDLHLSAKDSDRKQTDGLVIFITQPNTERPNATWRRRLAELRKLGYSPPRARLALVTSSILLRGLFTTLNWIVPMPAYEKMLAVETFEEACAWLVQETGRPLDYLASMHKTALSRIQLQRSG
jgi:hypothetical protein